MNFTRLFSHIKKPLNSVGMSLIEVMIIVTVMGLLGIGMTTLMKNLFIVQKKGNIKQSLENFKSNLEKTLRSDDAWAVTVNHAPNTGKLGCLRDNDTDGCGAGYSVTDFEVRDSNNNQVHGFTPTSGFDQDGEPCAAFNLATGNDDCPFRYQLTLNATCKPGPPVDCYKPRVQIIGVLQFSPANRDTPANRINLSQYRFVINRGDRDRFEPFEIQHRLAGGAGGGGCPAGAPGWFNRPLTSPEVFDSGGNVTMGANQFTLRPGTYECKVSAQSYQAINGFSIRLLDVTNNKPYFVGGAFSGFYSSAYATGTVSIEISSPATFRLQQFCSAAGTNNFDFGIPVPTAQGAPDTYNGPTVVANISCARTS